MKPDEQPEPTRSDLYAAHGEFLPVVEVDGVRRGYWRIEEFRLRKALVTSRRADISPLGFACLDGGPQVRGGRGPRASSSGKRMRTKPESGREPWA